MQQSSLPGDVVSNATPTPPGSDFPRQTPTPPTVREINAYAPPSSPILLEEPLRFPRRNYGGIGRTSFILLSAGVCYGFGRFGPALFGGSPDLSVVGFFFLLFAIAGFRLKNTGLNPLWCLTGFVPIVNLLLLIRCIMLPPGYQETKRLDPAGKLAAGMMIAGIFLIPALFHYLSTRR